MAVGVMESANGGVGTEAALPKAGTWVEMDGFGVADWFAGLRTLQRSTPLWLAFYPVPNIARANREPPELTCQ